MGTPGAGCGRQCALLMVYGILLYRIRRVLLTDALDLAREIRKPGRGGSLVPIPSDDRLSSRLVVTHYLMCRGDVRRGREETVVAAQA